MSVRVLDFQECTTDLPKARRQFMCVTIFIPCTVACSSSATLLNLATVFPGDQSLICEDYGEWLLLRGTAMLKIHVHVPDLSSTLDMHIFRDKFS